MKLFSATLFLVLCSAGVNVQAQVANDEATHNAIVQALPKGISPEQASADEIAQAATTLAFTLDGDLEANLTQVMVALEQLTRAGRFKNAPRFGDKNPPGRFYTKVLNMASSNLDVSSNIYYGLTVQDIIRLTAALREGMNFVVGAKSNAITRK